MEKMDSPLIHRSCTFIIFSSHFLSWNGNDGLITYSSFMYIHNSLFIFEVEMEKMDSSLISRSCTFIIVSSYFLSWNGKYGLTTNSSFMYIHNSLFIFFKLTWKKMDSSLIHRSCTFIIVSSYLKLKWKRWTHH